MARKLKKFVVPTLIGSVGILSLASIPLYNQLTKQTTSDYKYTIIEDESDYIPVVNEVEEKNPLRPYLEDTVGISKDFYNRNDDEQTQSNSLIYYEKTYMPNTGVLYSSDEMFDVIASYDGIVKKVSTDNVLGNYVEIEHDKGYKTVYYSLSETTVTEGTEVTKGDVIGTSGKNKLEGTAEFNLLFESYLNGYLLDPEEFYKIDLS